jgi:hypothetical protein
LLTELFDPNPPAATSVPSSLKMQRSVSAEYATHIVQDFDAMVQEMMIRIDHKLDIDTCRFLLESSDWNIETAVELFRTTYS